MDTSTDFPLYRIEEEEEAGMGVDEEPNLSQCIDTEVQCEVDHEANVHHCDCVDKEVPYEDQSEHVEKRNELEPEPRAEEDYGSRNDGDGDSTRDMSPETPFYVEYEPVEKLNFVLHPRLQLHHDSNTSCLSSPGPEILTFGRNKDPAKSALMNKGLGLERRKTVRFQNSGSSIRDSDFEIHVESKTVDEILYDIATGKWPSKSLVYDDEEQSTRKICERPCSNADCVREAERLRKRQQDILLQTENDACYDEDHNITAMGPGSNNNVVENDKVVFEEGNLPSYHSLISMWNVKNKFGWEENVFRNGYPTNDSEFLEAWRACRRNPEAFGMRVKPQQELPSREELRRISTSKTATLKAAIKKEILKSKSRNSVSLPGKMHNNIIIKQKETISPEEREKLKRRYNELREMYPHLPVLRHTDFKLNPSTVRNRLKQAEDWHRLVTTAYKPQPVKRFPKRDVGIRDKDNNEEPTGSPPELCDINLPRYAAATESFMHKMRSTMRSNIIDEPYGY